MATRATQADCRYAFENPCFPLPLALIHHGLQLGIGDPRVLQ